jgi:hypothetical protein
MYLWWSSLVTDASRGVLRFCEKLISSARTRKRDAKSFGSVRAVRFCRYGLLAKWPPLILITVRAASGCGRTSCGRTFE